MKKRYFTILSVLLVLMSLVLPAHAAASVHNESDTNSARFIPCPSAPSGYHYMDGRSAGIVRHYQTKEILLYGFASQCRYCLNVIISEYNPHLPGTTKLGYYGMYNNNDVVPSGVTMYLDGLYYNDNLKDEEFRGFIWS